MPQHLQVLFTAALATAFAAPPVDAEHLPLEQALTSTTPSYTNPVINSDFPDPTILPQNNGYWAYATNGVGGNVQARFSTDLVNWQSRNDAMPQLPAWVTPGLTWAPAVVQTQNHLYVLYFTARMGNTGKECIGIATSNSPAGPFQATSDQPAVCPLDEGGAIDASAFQDSDGTRYMVYKSDGNCCGLPTWVNVQKMTADGTALDGGRTQLFHQDQSWEGSVTEAPVMYKHNGQYYLFYSANDWSNASYTVAYARASNVNGPFTKMGQVVTSSNARGTVIGPGGQAIFSSRSGRLYMAYHSWNPGMNYRAMNVASMWFDGAGNPGVDASWGQSRTYPSLLPSELEALHEE